MRLLDIPAADLVLVVSPHGETAGVYRQARGSLDGFGIPGVVIDAPAPHGAAEALARAWGRPVLDVPADHGIVVPVTMVETNGTPLLALTFDEGAPAAETVADAHRVAEAIASLHLTVALLSSAHLSAGLTDRAPLGLLDGAQAADTAVLDALLHDPREVIDLLDDLTTAGGSCGAGPAALFSLLCAGMAATVHCYEHPFGVGYLVASARP